MVPERLRLDDRVALVFGAGGGGMGTHTALALAEAGATVVGVDLNDEKVRDTEQRIAAVGGRFLGVTANVRDRGVIDEVVAQAVAEFGGIDHLVNLVGGVRFSSASGSGSGASWRLTHEVDDELFEALVDLNFSYVFRSCRAVIAQMIEQGRGGSIVNFGSISALNAAPYQSIYGAMKAGVQSLTRTLANEMGQFDIRVNCVVPGSVPAPDQVATNAGAAGLTNDRAIQRAPLGRRVDPSEIAGAVLFLLSDLSGGITGQCIPVDVGASTNHPNGSQHDFAQTAAAYQSRAAAAG